MPEFGNVTRYVTDNDTNRHNGIKTAAQDSNHQLSITVTRHSDAIAVSDEMLANAVRAVRKAGFAAVNASDPRFMALLRDGATPAELAVIAAEATAKGKGWAWFLATVKGRRADAQEGPKSARQRAAEASVARWTPELAANATKGVL